MTPRVTTCDLDYELPTHLIATVPVEPRDSARMMVVRLNSPVVEHAHVHYLPNYLQRGDLLVFNKSGVARARLVMSKPGSTRILEGLFLQEVVSQSDRGLTWEVMIRGAGKLKPGTTLTLLDRHLRPSVYTLELRTRSGGHWMAKLMAEKVQSVGSHSVLELVGRTPLPPYILKARAGHESRPQRSEHDADEQDRMAYQTVYADMGDQRSIAAPTAGLHFTPGLFEALGGRGVEREEVRLHVGLGTFKPVATEFLDEHPMHEEHYEVSPGTLMHLRAQVATKAQSGHGRLICVGTTSVRVLESLGEQIHSCQRVTGWTRLMIQPGYRFRLVDGLLTNFHLPCSTLIALVAGLVGLERTMELYRLAVAEQYRFYSFGDAMLILPN